MHPMNAEMAAAANFDGPTIRSYAQKDKLLIFDREHAKRTHVHDAQADYYESSTWLTPEEKKLIDDKLRKKKERRDRRPTTKRITLDLAGRKVVEYIRNEDEDDTEELLVEADQTSPREFDAILHDDQPFLNTDLDNRRSRAGEVYRLMRQK